MLLEISPLSLKIWLCSFLFILAVPWVRAESGKSVVAHRGSSGYAPEHTVAAYRLALLQNADYVEQDLHVTSDGVLVCRHDITLERTTNVESVFPNRFRRDMTGDGGELHWHVNDFTLEELKGLDAGSWFDDKFAGSRILSFAEAVAIVRGKSGIYPELKDPEFYAERGIDMVGLFLEELKRLGLESPESSPETPVIIQCFSAETLRQLKKRGCRHPMTFLVNRSQADWLRSGKIKDIAKFADGIGPDKNLLYEDPLIVGRAQAAGLTVTPYTFRKTSVPEKFKDVTEEMKHALETLGADALFTDNPDMFPRD